MHEQAFIREILANPRDDVARQVYADWLEEQGDPIASGKAEYLRVTVDMPNLTGKERKHARRHLRHLAVLLDKSWLAIVSHLAIENCLGERVKPQRRFPLQFDYVCVRSWQDLQTTSDPKVRYCEGCSQSVHYCDTISQARDHADVGHCVAVDLGVERREGDLERPHAMTMGILASPEDFRLHEFGEEK